MDQPTLVFVITTVLKSVILLKILLGIVSYTVMAERVVSAAIQDRIGPNRVGVPLGGVTIMGFTIPNISLFGMGQPIADALKFMFKEDFTPAHVNKVYYWMAPAMAMAPALITLCAIPYASVQDITLPFFNNLVIPQPGVIANINVGVIFVFAITSLSVYGIVMAGWASNSKYSFLGGIRSSAQMISYEISMGLAVIPIFLIVGNLNLSEIIKYQVEHGWFLFPFTARPDAQSIILWFFLLISFVIFLVAAFAETNRAPFDLPESETELIGGYHTEYSSMKFALFFLGEYAAMIVASGLMVTLFLGGWSLPFGWFSGDQEAWWVVLFIQPLVFFVKVAAFLFLFIWVRWTVPRFRYDQLMGLGWKFFLPVALINVMIVAAILALFNLR